MKWIVTPDHGVEPIDEDGAWAFYRVYGSEREAVAAALDAVGDEMQRIERRRRELRDRFWHLAGNVVVNEAVEEGGAGWTVDRWSQAAFDPLDPCECDDLGPSCRRCREWAADHSPTSGEGQE